MNRVGNFKNLFIVLLCLLLYADFGLAAPENLAAENQRKRKRQRRRSSEERIEIPVDEGDAAIIQSNNLSASANTNTYQVTAAGLSEAGVDLDAKAEILNNSGCSVTEAACLLMSETGGGHSAEEISGALTDAGYNAEQVSNFLGNIVSVQSQTEQGSGSTPLSNLAGEENKEEIPVYLKNIPGALVFNDNRGQANQEQLQAIQDAIVNAQAMFTDMGFDVAPVEFHIGQGQGDFDGAHVQTNISKDGSSLQLIAFLNSEGDMEHLLDNVTMIMSHEYAHFVISSEAGIHDNTLEGRAIDEGTAIFFGTSMADNSYHSGDMDISDDYVFGEDIDSSAIAAGGATPEESNAILSWASALWDLRGSLGKESTEALVFAALSKMDGFTFEKAVNALLEADQQLNGGVNAETINKIMQDHGITS